MTIQGLGAVTVAMLSIFGVAGGEELEPWQSAEIVTFTDFDDLEVKLDGMTYTAFLVGLRPIRETVEGKCRQEQARKEVLAKLKANALSARVVVKRGKVVGLSLDTFLHHKNDFDHSWDPNVYGYCMFGWGAYNLNTYFLSKGTTTYQDNFGESDRWRELYAAARRKIEAGRQ